MSNSPLVTHTNLSPSRNSPRNHSIDKITIHHMAANTTVEACGTGFANPVREASANYGVDGFGHVGLYVDEGDRAWTSSSPENDNRAITIEVANDGGAPDWHVSDMAYYKMLDLVEDICRRNGIKQLNYTGNASGNLTIHKFFAATACPGLYLESKMPEIAATINARLNGNSNIEVIPVNITYQVYDMLYGNWWPDVMNRNDYAGAGQPIGIIHAGANIGHLYYRVHTKEDGWGEEFCDRADAGVKNKAIDGIMVRSDSTIVHCQVELEDGLLLPEVTGYDERDLEYGFAGIFGRNIGKVWIWADPIIQEKPIELPKPKMAYQVFDKNLGVWLPMVNGFDKNDDDNGYAGVLGHEITGICMNDDIEGDLEYGVGLVGAGWLGIVNGCDIGNVENGYAGRKDLVNSPAVDRVMIRSRSGHIVKYQVAVIGNNEVEWLPPVTGFNRADDDNGYAGVPGIPICALMVEVTGVYSADPSESADPVDSNPVEEDPPQSEPDIIMTPAPSSGEIDPVSAPSTNEGTADPVVTPTEPVPPEQGSAANDAGLNNIFIRIFQLFILWLKSLFHKT